MAKIGVYTYFPAYIGGGERYIMTFASALQYEHDVSFLCGNPEEYQQLSKVLDIDLSKVKFIEFHGKPNYRKNLFNHYFDQKSLDYDIFVAMANHITPPSIGLGRKNVLHIQFPYPCTKRSLLNIKNLIRRFINVNLYKSAIVNSKFTKQYVEKKFHHQVEIIYPPVEIKNFKFIPYEQKKNQIISVGRFIGTEDSKRQLEMVVFFKKMHDLHPNLGVRYLCVGGERPEAIHQEYLNQVRQEVQDYPITILTNVSTSELVQLYSESRFFWHAKGFGIDTDNPEYTEHFGISTVEAMASGCIPLVYKAGGQIEIVKEGFNGYLWESEDELIQKMANLLTENEEAISLSQNAYFSSTNFSSERFRLEVRNCINDSLIQ
jgi:glycosyltransferase involved in cell wall biosynthesis